MRASQRIMSKAPSRGRTIAIAGGAPVHEVETTYLDLDGDGVPDAVQTVEAVAVDLTGDGMPDVVEVLEEVASGIGVDGVPAGVAVIDEITVALEHVGRS